MLKTKEVTNIEVTSYIACDICGLEASENNPINGMYYNTLANGYAVHVDCFEKHIATVFIKQ